MNSKLFCRCWKTAHTHKKCLFRLEEEITFRNFQRADSHSELNFIVVVLLLLFYFILFYCRLTCIKLLTSIDLNLLNITNLFPTFGNINTY